VAGLFRLFDLKTSDGVAFALAPVLVIAAAGGVILIRRREEGRRRESL
jgi:hypothetical protein